MPVAAGEEWRNVFEAKLRLARAPLAYVQPEMAHTGVSQFVAIAKLAQARGAGVIPHATIGVGIFMAASLHASADARELSVPRVPALGVRPQPRARRHDDALRGGVLHVA